MVSYFYHFLKKCSHFHNLLDMMIIFIWYTMHGWNMIPWKFPVDRMNGSDFRGSGSFWNGLYIHYTYLITFLQQHGYQCRANVSRPTSDQDVARTWGELLVVAQRAVEIGSSWHDCTGVLCYFLHEHTSIIRPLNESHFIKPLSSRAPFFLRQFNPTASFLW